MNDPNEFVRALSEFLSLHTEQSAGYLAFLIQAFLRGAQGRPAIDPAAKDQVSRRLRADMTEHPEVSSFLQNFLLTHQMQDVWTPQAIFIASRYLGRSQERFMAWQPRQQLMAPLAGETYPGTELGFRQMLYSQGAGPLFRWRGVPCFKSCFDLAIYAMLIDELRPATIIELGSGTGGSALLLADLCAAAGLAPNIVSVDKTLATVSDRRISFVQSDCAAWLADTAKSNVELARPCLMIEDFHGDLASVFGSMDRILDDGDYLVVEDSFSKQERLSALIAQGPYLVDTKYTDFFGVNCTSAINSILVKRAASGS